MKPEPSSDDRLRFWPLQRREIPFIVLGLADVAISIVYLRLGDPLGILPLVLGIMIAVTPAYLRWAWWRSGRK